MKSIILACSILFAFICSYAHDPGEIEDKLMSVFKKTFPTAEKVNWHVSGETFKINFLDQGINTSLTYSKEGNLQESIRCYKENSLPIQLRVATKQQYPGKKIFGVTEVSRFTDASHHLGVMYYIKLEDERGWLTIAADGDGNSRVVEAFEK